MRPTRGLFVLAGGAEVSQWRQRGAGEGTVPSIETKYDAGTLPGLGAQPTYLHTQATVAVDSRPSPGYARYGTYVGVTGHDYSDTDGKFGFDQVDYEAIQHIPILRESWVISLRARLQTAFTKEGQTLPFYMLPSLGNGEDLRAYASWRFRDHNALLFQAEWRVMVNRFLDMALFSDVGQVQSHTTAFNSHDFRSDAGLGFRFHGAIATPLRFELTGGKEGFGLVMSASHAF